MTTATLTLSRPNGFLARAWAEIEAFFEEMHVAVARADASEPFGS